MKDIVDKFNDVGPTPNGTQFGAVCFSDRVQGHFHLNSYQTKDDIKEGIQGIIPKNGGATAIGAGLEVLFNNLRMVVALMI